MDPSTLKQLKIKVGSVNRNVKDILYAEKELAKEHERLSKFEALEAGEDRDDNIRRQKKHIAESEMMQPISVQRLKSVFDDLLSFSQQLPSAEETAAAAAAAAAEAAAAAAAAAAESGTAEEGEKKKEEGATATDEKKPTSEGEASGEEEKKVDPDAEARQSIKDALESAKKTLLDHGVEVEDD